MYPVKRLQRDTRNRLLMSYDRYSTKIKKLGEQKRSIKSNAPIVESKTNSEDEEGRKPTMKKRMMNSRSVELPSVTLDERELRR